MKYLNYKLFVAVALIAGVMFYATHCQAQMTNAVSTNTATGSLVKAGSNIRDFFVDNTNLFNAGSAMVEAMALYNEGSVGAMVDIQFPIEQQLSLGIGTLWLRDSFYTVTVNARVGKTWDLPVIGPIYTYVESGPAVDVDEPDTLLVQSFAGLRYNIPINSKWSAQLGAAVGNVSSISGPIYGAGASIEFSW